MIDDVLLATQTFLVYKLKVIGSKLLDFTKFILFKLLALILLPFKIIRKLFSFIYMKVYFRMSWFKKVGIRFLTVVGILDIATLLIIYFINDNFYYIYLIYFGLLVIGFIALYWLIKLYGFLIGEEDMMEALAIATEEYVEDFAPVIAKIYGDTGSGKDEAASGFAVIKSRQFKRLMYEEMKAIEKKAFIFNYDAIITCANINKELFYSSSEEKTKLEFLNLFRANNGFFKPYYKKTIDLEEFIRDAKAHHDNVVVYDSPWAYKVGLVNQKHYMDLAYDYLMLYIRLYIEKNCIWANQPMIEDVEEDLTAKVFSMDYLVTRKRENVTITDEATKQTEIYTEKIVYPFKDYNIFFETECGTWYMNLDNETKNEIVKLGIRDFKAFNRHFMPHFVYYAVDQDANRMFKVLKELDHSYIRIDSREVVDGGNAVNKLIELKLFWINFLINRKMKTRLLKNGPENLEKYKAYYRYTSKDKYKIKANELKKLLNHDYSAKLEELIKKKAKLEEKIEYNKYYYGYIKKEITVSKAPLEGDLDCVSVEKKVNEFKNDFKKRRKGYSISIVLRKRDAWRYDTHYMKAAKEFRAKNSELNMMGAENWKPNLLMTKSQMARMGYNAAEEMFNISPNESIKVHFKPLNKQQ